MVDGGRGGSGPGLRNLELECVICCACHKIALQYQSFIKQLLVFFLHRPACSN